MEQLVVSEFFPIAVAASSESKMEPLAVVEFFPIAVVVDFELKMDPFVVYGFFSIAIEVGFESKTGPYAVAGFFPRDILFFKRQQGILVFLEFISIINGAQILPPKRFRHGFWEFIFVKGTDRLCWGPKPHVHGLICQPES